MFWTEMQLFFNVVLLNTSWGGETKEWRTFSKSYINLKRHFFLFPAKQLKKRQPLKYFKEGGKGFSLSPGHTDINEFVELCNPVDRINGAKKKNWKISAHELSFEGFPQVC